MSDCPDICVGGKYEFQNWCDDWDKWHNKDINPILIMKDVDNGFKYRYRPTPTKKSHEELAEEYMKRPYEAIGIISRVRNAFIAGRKSMESES